MNCTATVFKIVFHDPINISQYFENVKHVTEICSTDQRKEYVKYAKVFPFSEMMDFKIPSKWYRRTVGALEMICGAAMAFIPNHKIKNASNIILLLLTLMAVYSHYMVADKLERTAPALVFLFMLSGRLVVYFQLQRREEDHMEPTVNGMKQE
ncbi:novel acetylcholine receptor chaperone isoform X2 [Leptinotarsa decemlineata]|uniref:novel acetylcholine receptor chaperone isoform X2 n=1 Tax=Leptinotarsa decemlineata TaxID=7539 RepID=UPI003D30700F